MNDRRFNNGSKLSKIDRIERKCDIILSELAIIRKSLYTRSQSVDDAIERMHHTSKRMRAEAERESRILRRVFQSK